MIVALLGLKGSGKDSLASKLAEDYIIYNLKFAGGIKKILEDYFQLTAETYESRSLKEQPILNNKSPRDLMIDIGNLFRKYDTEVWIKRLNKKIENIQNEVGDKSIIVITDLRFPEEYNYLLHKQVLFINIERPELYKLEKKIINILGVNWFSRLIIRFINPSLAVPSEWHYFSLIKKKEVLTIVNNDLRVAYSKLKDLLFAAQK